VTDWPGWNTVPTFGRLLAVNGAAGGVTEVTVTGMVPKLVKVTVCGTVIPTATGMTPCRARP
jgi:hypothetical protein